MKKFKHIILFLLAICIILAAAGFLFVRFYGKNILESALSEALGVSVRFKAFSVDLNKYSANFEGVNLPFFDADKCLIVINKEKFNKNREIIFESITIEKGVLHVVRNKRGAFSISRNNTNKTQTEIGVAYAEEIPRNHLYKFTKMVKSLKIRNSSLELTDHYLFEMPYVTTLENFSMNLTSGGKPDPSKGAIPVKAAVNFMVQNLRYAGKGEVFARADIDSYPFTMEVRATIEAENIDIMPFKPYFESYTPFIFTEGLFSSGTNFVLENDRISSLTTMLFHRLTLMVNPKKQNAKFLRTSANKILPYLTSRSGDIIFDFIITGTLDNPKGVLGPQVQQAVNAVISDEVSRVLRGLQGLK